MKKLLDNVAVWFDMTARTLPKIGVLLQSAEIIVRVF
jgi:hypothetical protein